MWQEAGALIFLGISARQDIRYRSISVDGAVITGALGLLIRMGTGRLTMAGLGSVLAAGLLLLMASILLGGAVGRGDALAAAVTGAWIGVRDSMLLVLLGTALAAVWGGAGVAAGKYRWKTKLPLIPFFLAAYLCMLAAGGI